MDEELKFLKTKDAAIEKAVQEFNEVNKYKEAINGRS